MIVVSLLAELFWNMEYCETAAVTPEVELAKLALVTSQDEEEDETRRACAESRCGSEGRVESGILGKYSAGPTR